jgi:2-deoxy-D-gluconate 3-dehydrogenase
MKKNSELINLNGKVAIVTGGAMGIGYGIVYRLCEAGASVVVADMNEQAGNDTVQKLKSQNYECVFIKTNMSVETDIQAMINFVVEKFGRLDILVNNAGIYPFVPLMQADKEIFEKVIHTNLLGCMLSMKYAGEQFIKQGNGGKIINITSVDALHPSSVGLAIYDSSKHGLWGLTKNAALELSQYNIQVNAIAPGGINTPGAGAGTHKTKEIEEVSQKFLQKIPMKRMGEPDDIGKVALFLASDMSSYITGTQIVVDGGVLLS